MKNFIFYDYPKKNILIFSNLKFSVAMVTKIPIIFLFGISLLSIWNLDLIVNVFGQTHRGGDGHNLPPSVIGDRDIFLKFENPEFKATEQGNLNFALMDNKTGNNIPHVTFVISVYDSQNKNLMIENFHGHDGEINLKFINKDLDKYRVSANYDNLAASYVSDFGSPIKIEGSIFNNIGDYKLIAEITGLDFDNTFLPTPLKYEYQIKVK